MRSTMLTREDYDKMIDRVSLCGKNRGPHDYIPIKKVIEQKVESVTMFMCRVCFNRVSMDLLVEHFDEIKFDRT